MFWLVLILIGGIIILDKLDDIYEELKKINDREEGK